MRTAGDPVDLLNNDVECEPSFVEAQLEPYQVDVVDDGETLATVAGGDRQDFIVANHFLEHTENPIGTIEHPPRAN